jgi:hypothetical protein
MECKALQTTCKAELDTSEPMNRLGENGPKSGFEWQKHGDLGSGGDGEDWWW